MFGTNEIAPVVWKDKRATVSEQDGQILQVNSIFPTIQGEGPYTGCPAIFVRLAGCNLRCHFCDTEFERAMAMSINDIVFDIHAAMDLCKTDLIVLTGGEPMRQQIIPMLCAFRNKDWHTQIETAGTVWPPLIWASKTPSTHSMEALIEDGAVELVCSPKTPSIHHKVEQYCKHYKYIIRAGETGPDGLPIYGTQPATRAIKAPLYRPRPAWAPTIWVQPCEEYQPRTGDFAMPPDPERTKRNTTMCVSVARQFGYRISLQTHKILGVE